MEKKEKEAADKIKAQIELEQQMKVKHGAIRHIINTDDKGVEHHLWLKSPSRLAVGVSLAKIDENVVEACEIIFNDSTIQEISEVAYFQTNDVFYGLIGELQRLVRVKKSTSTTL